MIPFSNTPAPFPDFLLELFKRAAPSAAPATAEGAPIPKGRRDDTLTSMAGHMRAAGFDEDSIFAALQSTNETSCDPPLDEKQVRKIAHSIGKKPAGVPGVTIKVSGNGNGHGTLKHDEAAAVRQPKLRRMSAVDPRDIKWLWPLWLPWNFLTILDGDPCLGKSTIALDLAARITTGSPMPFDTSVAFNRTPGGVLVLTAEDSLECTVRPRLDAAGADPNRVFAFEATWDGEDDDSEKPPEIPWDLELVKSLLVEEDIRLIVVDPLMAYLGEQVDAHKDQSVRRTLHLLKGFAEKHNVCLWVLRHLNKLSGGPALYRGGGSIGIVAGARVAWIAGRDPNDRHRHVLAMNKTNLGPSPESLVYRIVPAGKVSKIEWVETTDLTADDILSHPQPEKFRELDSAVQFLKEALSKGAKLTEDLEAEAKAKGISERTLNRARKDLKVEANKRFDKKWELSLPRSPTPFDDE